MLWGTTKRPTTAEPTTSEPTTSDPTTSNQLQKDSDVYHHNMMVWHIFKLTWNLKSYEFWWILLGSDFLILGSTWTSSKLSSLFKNLCPIIFTKMHNFSNSMWVYHAKIEFSVHFKKHAWATVENFKIRPRGISCCWSKFRPTILLN